MVQVQRFGSIEDDFDLGTLAAGASELKLELQTTRQLSMLIKTDHLLMS